MCGLITLKNNHSTRSTAQGFCRDFLSLFFFFLESDHRDL